MSDYEDTYVEPTGRVRKTEKPVVRDINKEIAELHERCLTTSADYKKLSALVDERVEATLRVLERTGEHADFLSLTGELRGLRAARGASTVRRGR